MGKLCFIFCKTEYTWRSFFLFSFATSAESSQQREPIAVGPYYLIPTLSTFPVGGTGVTRENPGLSVERRLNFFHMRTGFESTLRWTLLRIKLRALEVKGEWSDHYTTEAPLSNKKIIKKDLLIGCQASCSAHMFYCFHDFVLIKTAPPP